MEAIRSAYTLEAAVTCDDNLLFLTPVDGDQAGYVALRSELLDTGWTVAADPDPPAAPGVVVAESAESPGIRLMFEESESRVSFMSVD